MLICTALPRFFVNNYTAVTFLLLFRITQTVVLVLCDRKCLPEHAFCLGSLQLVSGEYLAYLVSTALNVSKYIIKYLVIENRKYLNEIAWCTNDNLLDQMPFLRLTTTE